MARGKLKLSSLPPGARKAVEEGMKARKEGKRKTVNPYRVRRGGETKEAELWWDLGYEEAYE